MLIAFWRTIFLYFLVIICLRFMGKRQLGDLQPSELVTTIIISNIAAVPIENMGMPLISSTIPILLLACLEISFSGLILKNRSLRRLIMGSPRAVIQGGVVIEDELRKIRWSVDDLMEELRCAGIFDISEVDYALVETTGRLSIYQKFEHRTVTNKDVKIKKKGKDSPSVIVISDCEIINEGLRFCKINEEWIHKTLMKEGLALSQVFIMSCDQDLDYVIFEKEKRQ